MREFSFHKKKIADAIDARDSQRQDAYERTKKSHPLKLPLVHRTGKRTTLKSILGDGQLRPPANPSPREAELNLQPGIYFFLGTGAYPNGSVALVFRSETANQQDSSYVPFDSGALGSPIYLTPSNYSFNWSDAKVRKSFLEDHTGDCKDLDEFELHYLNAHFRDVKNYVTRPQNSDPDWPPYHGLTSSLNNPDRRAWTIEIRMLASVALKDLQAIVLDGDDLLFLGEFADQPFGDNGPRVIVIDENDIEVEDSQDPVQRAVSRFIIEHYFPKRLFDSIMDND